MEKENKLLLSKIDELDKQYLLMKTRITRAHSKSQEQIGIEIERLKDEIAENTLLLQNTVAYCRSPALQKLADVHLNYCSQMEVLAKDLYKYMGETTQEKAEASALYAEYAVDFATQADRFALLAALEAIQIQNDEKENDA